MACYRRKGSRMFVAEFTFRGVRYREAAGTANKVEALRFEREFRTRIEKTAGGSKPTMTVEAGCEKYFREKLLPKQPRRTTAQKSISVLKAIRERFGASTPLADVGTLEISEWRGQMLAEGKAPGTANRNLAVLRAILNLAHKDWLVLEVMPRVMMVPSGPATNRYLSDDEVEALIAASPEHLARMLKVAISTGMRLSEMTSLLWKDVDLTGDRGHITVVRSKSGRSRGIPLTHDLTEMLIEMKSEGAAGPYDHVLTWKRADGVRLPFTSVRTSWQKARERAGVPSATIHSFRHSFAARLVRRGVPLFTLQQLMGHASPVQTAAYSSLARHDLDDAISKLDQ